MLRLMKKFAFWYILYPALLLVFGLPLFNHDRLTGPDPFSLDFATYLAPMIWLVLGAMYSHEQSRIGHIPLATRACHGHHPARIRFRCNSTVLTTDKSTVGNVQCAIARLPHR